MNTTLLKIGMYAMIAILIIVIVSQYVKFLSITENFLTFLKQGIINFFSFGSGSSSSNGGDFWDEWLDD